MKLVRRSLCAFGFLGLLAAGCGRTDRPTAAAPLPPTASVRVETVVARKHAALEEITGTIRAVRQARLEAKIPGRIAQMRAEPGQAVKSGEVLARLEAQETRARLDQALAVRQQAGGDLKRYATLRERGAVTPAEFDAVQARARVADAAAAEAQTVLESAEITAPFGGVITRKLADVGDLAAPGKALIEMEDPARLRFETDIPEALLGAVRPGGVLPVRLPSLPGELRGTVSEIAPAADPNTRTFRVKLDLPGDERLRAGQFGRVSVPVAETLSLRVSASALVQRGQLYFVFVVEGSQAVMRLVKPGRRIGDEFEIASGLVSGEQVVIGNPASLLDGQRVEVRP